LEQRKERTKKHPQGKTKRIGKSELKKQNCRKEKNPLEGWIDTRSALDPEKTIF
jgi:hypothetical protein